MTKDKKKPCRFKKGVVVAVLRRPGRRVAAPQTFSCPSIKKIVVLFSAFLSLWYNVEAQQPRTDISLDNGWYTLASDSLQEGLEAFESAAVKKEKWKKVSVPHNWDDYEGYRRLRHGNKHGYAYYTKTFSATRQGRDKRYFLFFEGVGSYATVWLNEKKVGHHAGGRTTFTIDVTDVIRFHAPNRIRSNGLIREWSRQTPGLP